MKNIIMNERVKQLLNSKEKFKIIINGRNTGKGKKEKIPKPEKFKGIEREIIYINEIRRIRK